MFNLLIFQYWKRFSCSLKSRYRKIIEVLIIFDRIIELQLGHFQLHCDFQLNTSESLYQYINSLDVKTHTSYKNDKKSLHYGLKITINSFWYNWRSFEKHLPLSWKADAIVTTIATIWIVAFEINSRRKSIL